MINMVMMLFDKEAWDQPKVLEILLVDFLIFLKNFLEVVLAHPLGKEALLEEMI